MSEPYTDEYVWELQTRIHSAEVNIACLTAENKHLRTALVYANELTWGDEGQVESLCAYIFGPDGRDWPKLTPDQRKKFEDALNAMDGEE